MARRCREEGIALLRVRAEQEAVTVGPYVDETFSPCLACACADEPEIGPRPEPARHDIVVGLAANKSLWDWLLSALAVLPLHVVGALRRETRDIGVVTRSPRESFTEIRAAASRILPTARARRRFYYRYTLIWDRSMETL